jgi:sugar/nucleoside kinase (ribokinase family)
VKPLDTTAAGDVFNGALAVGLIEGRALGDAVRFANAAAAISVTRMGAQPSAPGSQEILRFVKANETGSIRSKNGMSLVVLQSKQAASGKAR